jgi:hypothetical protein
MMGWWTDVPFFGATFDAGTQQPAIFFTPLAMLRDLTYI